MARRRLADITLEGGAQRARLVLFILIALSAAAAAIGYMLPGHAREYETTYHSNFADGGYTPFLFLTIVAVLAAGMHLLRFGAGILVGACSVVVAIVEALRSLLEHLLSTTYSTYGDVIHGLGLGGMLLIGLVLPFTELVLFYSARSTLERAEPKIPSARVVG